MFVDMASRRRRRSGGGVDYAAAAVQSALSGTGGFALDFADTSRLWQDTAKTIPVTTAGQSIAAATTIWGAGPYDFAQTTASDRPLWNGGIAADFDGTSQYLLGSVGARSLLNNKPAGFACGKFIFDSLAVAQPVFMISTNAGSSARFFLRVDAAGSLTAVVRVTDGGTSTTGVSATGLITTGVAYVITMTCDYAGSGGVKVYLDGVEVVSVALAVAPGNTSATNSSGWFIGRNIAALQYMNGRSSRQVYGDKVFTAGEIASIEAWVGDGALA